MSNLSEEFKRILVDNFCEEWRIYKMKNEQYLLSKLSEGCSKVVTVACEASQYGLSDRVYHTGSKTNEERVADEVLNVIAAIEVLQESNLVDFNRVFSNGAEKEVKKMKEEIIRQMKVATSSGE